MDYLSEAFADWVKSQELARDTFDYEDALERAEVKRELDIESVLLESDLEAAPFHFVPGLCSVNEQDQMEMNENYERLED